MIILSPMNKARKKSIAKRLAVRASVAFTLAFALLLAGAYFSLNRAVREEGLHYAKALTGIYADMMVYEANNMDSSIDLPFSDRLSFFGEYMCTWYRVDYIYSYVPDFENGTITYLSVTRNRNKFGDLSKDHMVGVTEKYAFSEEEIRAWSDSSVFAIRKSERFEKATEVMMMVRDGFGNRAMVGTAVSTDELRRDVRNGFLIIALLMLVAEAVLACLLYLLIRKTVSDPARSISQYMSDYISGGKRSDARLDSDDYYDEFGMIAGAFNRMTEDIDSYINDIAFLEREQERQRTEVDIAASIQKGLLPAGKASLGDCSIMAVMKPAKDVGGDLYYYFKIDSSHTMIVVADVSGKGISSAMVMSMTLTLVRQFARMGCSPASILGNVNDAFSERNPQMMFITAFVGIYDSAADTFTYANAGHNPPYLIHGVPRILDDAHGTPLGLFPGEEYADVSVPMEDGDSVFLYTDGVNEAVNASGEFYGTDRLERVLAETAGTGDYAEAVEASVQDFVGDAVQNDDLTILVLKAGKRPMLELDYDIREFSSIKETLFASGLPKQLLMDLCVAAEECLVNICSYAFDGDAPEGEKILFSLEYSDEVTLRFIDGGRPFDPRHGLPDADEYDIDTAVGGLGRLIAFTVADSVDYEYRDGRNILTIRKSINQ